MKAKTVFFCTECGNESPKWSGRCSACGACVERCAFSALTVDLAAQVDVVRCAGCGQCVAVCPQEALTLVRRPEAEVLAPPLTEDDWRSARAAARGVELARTL